MKRVFFLTACIALVAGVFAQTDKSSGPSIAWEKSTFDFGDIVQGEKVEHTFRFTNTGNQPLIITNVQVTCGCTTPKGWPRDPIAAGAKGEVTIAFNSTGKLGKQNKVITIMSNAVNTENQIMFSANVMPKSL
ncbi:MAG TPA: DUF1573 domain-containing protein [Cyclobacteriaceae bacterium]|jgi:hypothetical protein|nr:DUF1573 domain-containing protein [Cyclobacteriaceae bacterium]